MKPTMTTPSPQSLVNQSSKPSPTLKQQSLSAKAEKFLQGKDADSEEAELYRKAWNAAEAKVRRICNPKEVSGKVDADQQTVAKWQDTAGGRNELIKMMMDAQGSKACYHQCQLHFMLLL